MINRASKKLLDAVTATGASNPFDAARYRYFTFVIVAASVTTGGTMKIQTMTPDGTWVDVPNATFTINANGNTVFTLTGAHDQLRANLTARTDGTYTVTVTASD